MHQFNEIAVKLAIAFFIFILEVSRATINAQSVDIISFSDRLNSVSKTKSKKFRRIKYKRKKTIFPPQERDSIFNSFNLLIPMIHLGWRNLEKDKFFLQMSNSKLDTIYKIYPTLDKKKLHLLYQYIKREI